MRLSVHFVSFQVHTWDVLGALVNIGFLLIFVATEVFLQERDLALLVLHLLLSLSLDELWIGAFTRIIDGSTGWDVGVAGLIGVLATAWDVSAGRTPFQELGEGFFRTRGSVFWIILHLYVCVFL